MIAIALVSGFRYASACNATSPTTSKVDGVSVVVDLTILLSLANIAYSSEFNCEAKASLIIKFVFFSSGVLSSVDSS